MRIGGRNRWLWTAAIAAAGLTINMPALALNSGGDEPSTDYECTNSTADVSDDPVQRGPWPVGSRTVEVARSRGGSLTAEVWYPAMRGSEVGQSKRQYDLRQFFTQETNSQLPEGLAVNQPCDCYQGLPLAEGAGPFPVVVFIHGTASFRTASSEINAHWASRGFVVISADHPDIMLGDLASSPLGILRARQADDAGDLIDALRAPSGGLAFLDGHVDTDRIGVSGHSAGGAAAAQLSDTAGVRVIMPMASGGTQAGEYLESSLVLGGEADGIAAFSAQVSGYESSPQPKRLVGLADAGHMAFTDLCAVLPEYGGIPGFLREQGIETPEALTSLATDGCGANALAPERGWEVINAASTAVLEETLQCASDRADAVEALPMRFDAVSTFRESL